MHLGKFQARIVGGTLCKVCTKCKENKPVNEFYKRKNTRGCNPDGLEHTCKKCYAKYVRSYKESHHENFLKFYSAAKARYWVRNRKRLLIQAALLRATPEYQLKRSEYEKRKRDSDVAYKILGSLRNRLNDFVTKGAGEESMRSIIGCSLVDLLKHLGLDNSTAIGIASLSIDHVIPCVMFNLGDERQRAACFNFTNLRVIPHSDNASKQDMLDDGRRARNLTQEEKISYLTSHGHGYLFPTAPTRP